MNSKKIIVSSLFVAGLILIVGCAGKFHKENFGNFIFERFDKNKDNQLSKKEHLNLAMHRFLMLDENENGMITKKEIQSSKLSRMVPNFKSYIFNKYDLDGDFEVTKAELIEKTKTEFVKVDLNSDGLLSKSEYKKIETPFKNKD